MFLAKTQPLQRDALNIFLEVLSEISVFTLYGGVSVLG